MEIDGFDSYGSNICGVFSGSHRPGSDLSMADYYDDIMNYDILVEASELG